LHVKKNFSSQSSELKWKIEMTTTNDHTIFLNGQTFFLLRIHIRFMIIPLHRLIQLRYSAISVTRPFCEQHEKSSKVTTENGICSMASHTN